jgi:hypothetical protein
MHFYICVQGSVEDACDRQRSCWMVRQKTSVKLPPLAEDCQADMGVQVCF